MDSCGDGVSEHVAKIRKSLSMKQPQWGHDDFVHLEQESSPTSIAHSSHKNNGHHKSEEYRSKKCMRERQSPKAADSSSCDMDSSGDNSMGHQHTKSASAQKSRNKCRRPDIPVYVPRAKRLQQDSNLDKSPKGAAVETTDQETLGQKTSGKPQQRQKHKPRPSLEPYVPRPQRSAHPINSTVISQSSMSNVRHETEIHTECLGAVSGVQAKDSVQESSEMKSVSDHRQPNRSKKVAHITEREEKMLTELHDDKHSGRHRSKHKVHSKGRERQKETKPASKERNVNYHPKHLEDASCVMEKEVTQKRVTLQADSRVSRDEKLTVQSDSSPMCDERMLVDEGIEKSNQDHLDTEEYQLHDERVLVEEGIEKGHLDHLDTEGQSLHVERVLVEDSIEKHHLDHVNIEGHSLCDERVLVEEDIKKGHQDYLDTDGHSLHDERVLVEESIEKGHLDHLDTEGHSLHVERVLVEVPSSTSTIQDHLNIESHPQNLKCKDRDHKKTSLTKHCYEDCKLLKCESSDACTDETFEESSSADVENKVKEKVLASNTEKESVGNDMEMRNSVTNLTLSGEREAKECVSNEHNSGYHVTVQDPEQVTEGSESVNTVVDATGDRLVCEKMDTGSQLVTQEDHLEPSPEGADMSFEISSNSTDNLAKQGRDTDMVDDDNDDDSRMEGNLQQLASQTHCSESETSLTRTCSSEAGQLQLGPCPEHGPSDTGSIPTNQSQKSTVESSHDDSSQSEVRSELLSSWNSQSVEEESWDKLFDDTGEALDSKLIEELTAAVGSVKVQKPEFDYYNYQPKDPDIDYEAYSHLVEIYNFPSSLITRDLVIAFKEFEDSGFDIKWVDDNHAIGVFSSAFAAKSALTMTHPLIKVRPLCEATRQTKVKAKKSCEFLQPYRPRPETVASVARNLVVGALGLRSKIPKEKRDEERRKLNDAREKKRQSKREKQDAWDGIIGHCAMDEL